MPYPWSESGVSPSSRAVYGRGRLSPSDLSVMLAAFRSRLAIRPPEISSVRTAADALRGMGPSEVAAAHAAIRQQLQTALGVTDPVDRGLDPTDGDGWDGEAVRAQIQPHLTQLLALAVRACDLLAEDDSSGWVWRPYDVQLQAALSLLSPRVAEMATGEGKTLVAALAASIWAATGLGVHVATANSYLAQRDAVTMAPLYAMLGLSVSCVDGTAPLSPARAMTYEADVTYCTTTELVFDHLRDMMQPSVDAQMQRPAAGIALLDEADSLLLDEARTPFIIAGPSPDGPLVASTTARWAPAVAALWAAQLEQVAVLRDAVRERLAEVQPDAARRVDDELGQRLWLLQHAAPRDTALRGWLQDPVLQGRMERTSRQLSTGRKVGLLANAALQAARDHALLVWIDDRERTVELTERGYAFLETHGPAGEPLMLPDQVLAAHALSAPATGATADETSADASGTAGATAGAVRPDAAGDAEAYQAAVVRLRMMQALLKAWATVERDVDYVVVDGTIQLVDDRTGRILPGRRWSEGLHTAVEAKEGVQLQPEQQTIASMTLQHYLKRYAHLAGMTGTAATSAPELGQLYQLDVVVIPRHRPSARRDLPPRLFTTRAAKHTALVELVAARAATGQPVLIGTSSVAESEQVSAALDRRGLRHTVLNAVRHGEEAAIVGQAGQRGAITVATNMAGRGTDILLGEGVDRGPEGGLWVIGTELNESRRVDAQLRGRAGRQGDPGTTQFLLSAEDSLVRRWGADQLPRLIQQLGADAVTGEIPFSPLLGRMLDRLQQRVETDATASRKRLVDYDEVLGQQRDLVYGVRQLLLRGGSATDRAVTRLAHGLAETWVERTQPAGRAPGRLADAWRAALSGELSTRTGVACAPDLLADDATLRDGAALTGRLRAILDLALSRQWDALEAITITSGQPLVSRRVVASLVVGALDSMWLYQLQRLDELQAAISLRSIGQKDPLVEYRREAWETFSEHWFPMAEDVVSRVLRLRLSLSPAPAPAELPEETPVSGGATEAELQGDPDASLQDKTGRSGDPTRAHALDAASA